jgi:MoaA/NifB/PqqE/SkfB family radical SAM enzyme
MLYLNDIHKDILTRNVPDPVGLNIELTTGCNLKCIMCRGSHNYVKESEGVRHLTIEEFTSILSGIDLNRLKILNFAGNAEPLLSPEIPSILTLCLENKIIVEFITNGMLLAPQISKQLVGCASEIHISFGGSRKKTFESIRQGTDFDLIVENIRLLSKAKKVGKNSYPRIWLNPILMKRNIHELPEIVNLAKELDCQGVACSHLIVNSPELIEESLFFCKEECNAFLKKATELADMYEICLLKPEYFSAESDYKENGNKLEAWRRCRFLWNRAVLGIEGIIPCSGNSFEMDFDRNVIRNKFMDIWNNDWYANMRSSLLTGNPPEECMNCKDPSVKDVNHIGSYFDEKVAFELLYYVSNESRLSQETQLIENMSYSK